MNGEKTKKSNHLGSNFFGFNILISNIVISASLSLFMIQLIKLYRYYLSPMLPASCRFYPSCSAYAQLSFQRLGFWKGTFLSLWRIFKCNPFHPGGFDPVSGENIQNYKSCKKNH